MGRRGPLWKKRGEPGIQKGNAELTLMLSCYSRLRGLLNWKGAGLAGDVPVKQIPHASESPSLSLPPSLSLYPALSLSLSLSLSPPPLSPHLPTLYLTLGCSVGRDVRKGEEGSLLKAVPGGGPIGRELGTLRSRVQRTFSRLPAGRRKSPRWWPSGPHLGRIWERTTDVSIVYVVWKTRLIPNELWN